MTSRFYKMTGVGILAVLMALVWSSCTNPAAGTGDDNAVARQTLSADGLAQTMAVAWFKENTSGTKDGKTRLRNAMKLADMSGNVEEWREDTGTWNTPPRIGFSGVAAGSAMSENWPLAARMRTRLSPLIAATVFGSVGTSNLGRSPVSR